MAVERTLINTEVAIVGAGLVGLTAAIALFRFKMNAIPVILGCGVLGMLYGWLAI